MQAIYENLKQDVYCRDSRHASKTLGYRSHLHASIELAVVFEGHTRVTVDSKEYDVRAGDAFVVFPNQIHYFETVERERYILLKFNPDVLPEFLSQFTGCLPLSNIIPGAANDPILSQMIRLLSDTYYSRESFREEILRGYLLAFFGKLLQKIQLQDIQSRDYNVLGMIMNYCLSHYDKDLSLGLLEKELHISKYYISHVMSSKLRIGFNDYINSLRISTACKLLSQTDKSVTEISEQVGFNTLRTFNRAFLKDMEMTPSAYRQKKKRERSIRADSSGAP
ncbi:MAG: AraC family transcriptional regulator [Clostridia bacterium]|nr:AraC family transcriptional regulator [Clostridia bacterium]